MRNFLSKHINFPEPTIILFTFLAVIGVILVLRPSETKYSYERFYGQFVNESELIKINRDTRLENRKEESLDRIESERPQGKYEADLATFALWALVGIIVYSIWNSFYKAFIKPFYNDVVESHYINAKPENLLKKRILWVLSVFFTFTLIAVTIYLFQTVVLPLYVLATYTTTLLSVTDLLLGIILTTLTVVMIKLGLDVIFRTY
jgi:hypothetical protein